MEPPNEFYIWGRYTTSLSNLDPGVWDNFEVATFAGRLVWKERARCKLCGNLVGWSGSSGNLKKHLKRRHGRVFAPVTTTAPVDSRDLLGILAERIRCPEPINLFGRLCVGGNVVRRRKYKPEWAFFFHTCRENGKVLESHRVMCAVCGRDICWGGRGLKPLRDHIERVHLSTESRRIYMMEALTKNLNGKVSFEGI
jgi:hypothetical protein